jgi:hypothetical protein
MSNLKFQLLPNISKSTEGQSPQPNSIYRTETKVKKQSHHIRHEPVNTILPQPHHTPDIPARENLNGHAPTKKAINSQKEKNIQIPKSKPPQPEGHTPQSFLPTNALPTKAKDIKNKCNPPGYVSPHLTPDTTSKKKKLRANVLSSFPIPPR